MPTTYEQDITLTAYADGLIDAKPKTSTVSLAAGLAMLACVAACTVPLLLAGGLTAGLGTLVTDSNVLAVVILAATAAGAYLWWRRHQSAAVASASGGC